MTELNVTVQHYHTYVSGVEHVAIHYYPSIDGLVAGLPGGVPIVRNCTLGAVQDTPNNVFTNVYTAIYFYDDSGAMRDDIADYINIYAGDTLYERGLLVLSSEQDEQDRINELMSEIGTFSFEAQAATAGLIGVNIALANHAVESTAHPDITDPIYAAIAAIRRAGDRKVSNYPLFDRTTNDFTVAQDHDGWLECDSSDLTRLFNQDQYPDLFSVIGFSFSPGNTEPATGKFQLPYDEAYHPDARHFIFAGAPAY